MKPQDPDVHSRHRSWDPVALPPHRWLPSGLFAGLVGGAGVALWFLVLDMLARVPLYTPAALGSVLFYGAAGAGEIRRNAVTIGGYTVLHFAVFMALGALFSWLVDKVESAPRRWLIAVMAFILFDGLFAGTLMMVGEWVMSTLGVWAVAIANIIAVALMAIVVWTTHPVLRSEFLHRPAETSV